MTSARTAGDRGADDGGRVPRALDLAAVGVLVEVAALVAGAAWAVVDLAAGRSAAPGRTVFLAVFALGVAAVLVGAVRALRRGARRARGPLVTWQLLQAATGLTLLGVTEAPRALPWGAGVAVALALAVTAAVVSPSAVRFTAD